MAADIRPFVGPVAFREDQGNIFFGRQREARELLSMIIAHPLVLLYAPSGAGKSSLINAKLVGLLRERGIQVLGPARVKGELPSDAKAPQNVYAYHLLSGLRDRADRSAAADDLPGFLSALPHPIDEAGENVLRVLIVDQLEDLFTFAPESWPQRETFIRQLAAALDADPLLRILLAINEDCLAQLDAFAALLPGQLAHRFRLDLLSPDAAQQAIEEPLKLSDREIDPDALRYLRDELLKIRMRGAAGATSEVVGPHVEPTQLQVVCDAVAKSLPNDVKRITIDHVRAVGDVDGALRRFYENVLAETARKTGTKEDALRAWVDEYLITPEGMRGLAYQGSERTGRGRQGIPNAAAAKLEEEHLLRAETRGGGERWYELCNDRFIRPIQDSNQQWRRRALRRKYAVRLGMGFMATVVALGGLGAYWSDREAKRLQEEAQRRQEYDRAEGQIDGLLALSARDRRQSRIEAEKVLPNVAAYLWQKGDTARLETQLKRAESLIGEDFGADRWVPLVMPQPTGDVRLTVQYGARSHFDRGKLQYEWAVLVRELARMWGIPSPEFVRFTEHGDLPRDEVRVRAAAGEEKRIALTPLEEGWVVVSDGAFQPRLRAWFESRQDQWLPIKEIPYGGRWWGVPAWTVPLLRAAGARPFAHESVAILAVLNAALDEPDLLLTEENTTLLLRDLRFYGSAVTVDQALVARGGLGQIAGDLQALVREKASLVHLGYVVDSLAHAPSGGDAREAAQFAVASYASPNAPARARLIGSSPQAVPKLDEKMPAGSYAATLRYAPLQMAPVRVRVGTGLEDLVDRRSGKPAVQLLERVETARGNLYRELGAAPELGAWQTDEDMGRAFAIEVLNQVAGDEDAKPVEVAQGGSATQLLLEALESRYSSFAGWWLTAEDVKARLDRLPRASRGWLLARYSVTDITAILRRLLDDERGSLRQTSWLLESLLFWAQAVEDPLDGAALARALAQTQNSRLHPSDQAPTVASIEKGIAALERSDAAAAAGHFKAAVAANRQRAVDAFLAAYARRDAISAQGELQRLQSECDGAEPGKMSGAKTPSDATRFEVEDYVAQHAIALSSVERAAFDLCLARAYVRTGLKLSAKSTLERLAGVKPDELTPNQLYAAGYWSLELEGFPAQLPASADSIARLLGAAFTGWDKDLPAEAAFRDLIDRYRGRFAIPNWYFALLKDLANRRQSSLVIAFDMGQQQAALGRSVADGEEALKWLARAEARLDDLADVEERARWRAWIQKRRSEAHLLRALHGDAAVRREATGQAQAGLTALIAELREGGRLRQQGWPGQEALFSLIDAHRMVRDVEGEAAALNAALAEFPDSPELARAQATLRMMSGNIPDAIQRTRQWLDRRDLSADNRHAFKFDLAILELLSGGKEAERAARAFLASDDPYSDYVRLMLYWRLSLDGKPRARTLLEERWAQIKTESWPPRLEAGDEQVWRERLIGYYLGKVEESDLLAPLKDRSTFEKSPYSRMGVQGLSFDGMTCEAQFYTGLLHNVTGDPATREPRLRDRLRKCVEVGQPMLIEYQMASCLLSRASRRP